MSDKIETVNVGHNHFKDSSQCEQKMIFYPSSLTLNASMWVKNDILPEFAHFKHPYVRKLLSSPSVRAL